MSRGNPRAPPVRWHAADGVSRATRDLTTLSASPPPPNRKILLLIEPQLPEHPNMGVVSGHRLSPLHG